MLSKSISRIYTSCLRQTTGSQAHQAATRYLSTNTIIQSHKRCGFKTLQSLNCRVSSLELRAGIQGRGQKRGFASNKSPVDSVVEEITELYSTARDEFEIATSETTKQTVYAASDREAAREEFSKLLSRYNDIVGIEGKEGSQGQEIGGEVKRRIGGRIRELERAMEILCEQDLGK